MHPNDLWLGNGTIRGFPTLLSAIAFDVSDSFFFFYSSRCYRQREQKIVEFFFYSIFGDNFIYKFIKCALKIHDLPTKRIICFLALNMFFTCIVKP